mgnify:CR=1 FL=1
MVSLVHRVFRRLLVRAVQDSSAWALGDIAWPNAAMLAG